MSDTKVLDGAAEMAEPFEGFRSRPYQDVGGVWTQGFGSTRDASGAPVTEHSPPVSRARALQMLARDMRESLLEMKASVKAPLTDNEEEALTDLVYNVGIGHLSGTTLMRDLNAGDYAGAADQIEAFDTVKGRPISGLLRRRMAERTEFLAGASTFLPPNALPQPADGNGDPVGNAITERLNEEEAAIGRTA